MTDQIFGYIERITYQNPENGYTVAKLQEPKKSSLTCIVGTMPAVQPGESVRCHGEWKRHLIHGQQFEVKTHKTEAPADLNGIQKYLGSGLVKGIGPTYAKRIVEQFGVDTLHVIDSEPHRLKEVPGLGKKRIEKITNCWSEQKSIREVMIFLQSHGVSPTYAQKIFKTYGKKSIEIVQNTPYALAKDIFGIGFKKADTIAAQLGIEKDSPQRIEAGIEHVLSTLSNDGHVCYPLKEFYLEAEQILEVEKSLVQEAVCRLKTGERIEVQELVHDGELTEFIWIRSLFLCEMGISHQIKRLIRSKSRLRQIDIPKALAWVQEKLNIQLGDNQKEAVGNAFSEKVQIITGGPGTGKSTITNAILTVTEKLTGKIFLAAPTGRAAKRMSEITGKKAQTIHSLLEFDFSIMGFKKCKEDPLDCDLLIIDEASMIDTKLMYSLLKAIPSNARVILVGDINQLPSVGAGNVLKDIITSRVIPVTMLNEIFRQAEGSSIVTNAHRINEGNFPDLANKPDGDFFFIEALDPEQVMSNILALVTQRLPKKYRLHPLNDIQVLAPMKRGPIGTECLNIALQEALNPKNPPLFRGGQRYAVGDKVMQIRNNYKREVYNGDVGRIAKIDQAEQQLIVTMDNKDVLYDFTDLDELMLAYAVSVHKYQGSECPCIVMPIHTSHFKLLHRNLLYTGVTRGKQLVILVGTKKALALAIHNNEVQNRYTGLVQALLENSYSMPI